MRGSRCISGRSTAETPDRDNTSHDLADAKEYREFYITPAALDAVRKDHPEGFELTLDETSTAIFHWIATRIELHVIASQSDDRFA